MKTLMTTRIPRRTIRPISFPPAPISPVFATALTGLTERSSPPLPIGPRSGSVFFGPHGHTPAHSPGWYRRPRRAHPQPTRRRHRRHHCRRRRAARQYNPLRWLQRYLSHRSTALRSNYSAKFPSSGLSAAPAAVAVATVAEAATVTVAVAASAAAVVMAVAVAAAVTTVTVEYSG